VRRIINGTRNFAIFFNSRRLLLLVLVVVMMSWQMEQMHVVVVVLFLLLITTMLKHFFHFLGVSVRLLVFRLIIFVFVFSIKVENSRSFCKSQFQKEEKRNIQKLDLKLLRSFGMESKEMGLVAERRLVCKNPILF
jgi:hypothetical protein